MNSFESDLRRAIISFPFFIGVVLEVFILMTSGADSDLFRVSIPVVATFPYSTAWLLDYQSGFVKLYVSRAGVNQYILGKIIACGIGGGALEVLGCFIYSLTDKQVTFQFELVFVVGMLWAVLAATVAAISNSKYIAYGGSFVFCYVLVILHDRYFKNVYCLYPYEWIKPEHTWVFDKQGIVILISGMTLLCVFLYYKVVRRCIERV